MTFWCSEIMVVPMVTHLSLVIARVHPRTNSPDETQHERPIVAATTSAKECA